MTTMVEEKRLNLVHLVLAWQEKHPYLFANIIAVMITAYIMFSMLAVEVTEEDLTPSDNIEFIDIDHLVKMTEIYATAAYELSASL